MLGLFAALLALAPMSAYGDSGDDLAADAVDAAAADRFTVSADEAKALRAARPAKAKGPQHGELGLRVLSNRADLISDGNALVEVVFPHRFTDDNVTVTLNGHDVTSAFALRADETFSDLLSGLVLGDNAIVAHSVPAGSKSKTKGARTARLTITNHPASGPVFAGAQLQPWVCAQPAVTPTVVTIPGTSLTATVNSRASGLDGAADATCSAPSKYTYWYQPATRDPATCAFTNTGATRCFEPYNLAAPPAPADIASFTNDRGDTVKSIVRVERGTMNRGIYELGDASTTPTQPTCRGRRSRAGTASSSGSFGASSTVAGSRSPPAPTTVWTTRAAARLHGRDLLAHRPRHERERHARRRDDDDGEGAHRSSATARSATRSAHGCSGGSIMQHLNIAGRVSRPARRDPAELHLPRHVHDRDRGHRLRPARRALLDHDAANGAALSTGAAKRDQRPPDQRLLQRLDHVSVPAVGQPGGQPQLRLGLPGRAHLRRGAPRRRRVRCTASDHDVGDCSATISARTATTLRQLAPLDNVGIQYGLNALRRRRDQRGAVRRS